MKELLIIAVGSALVNNVVLSQFLGICPFLGVSKKIETAAGMGGAVVFVITIASFITGAIYQFILHPAGFEYLQTIVFILVIAALVQFVEMFLKKVMPPLYNALGVYLPLITTNCAVLGVSLNCVTKGYNILEGVVYGFSTAVGFTIAIVIMAGIREKIEYNDISESFQGTPIVLLTACLLYTSKLKMEVIRAKSAGFCFGVKRAVDTVYEQVEKQMGKQIYTYGPIIHNEEVVKDMEAHGVKVLRGEEELKGLEEGLVIIRSHGVPKRICDLMDEKGIEYVDATCPFVKRIHKIVAEESKKGSRIIIIGNPDRCV